ncbi:MAG TPA: type II toxin-antitoxin system VapC family toxin [Tepidisphaeraceae bacterium]|nr:type II toxin-antitoxin system VapC family toxin [Tepidisphaeraceae bacterium]
MLDTNVCVGLLRGSRRSGTRWLTKHPVDQVGLSMITLAELWYGVSKSADAEGNRSAVIDFCTALAIAPFDAQAAAAYGEVRARLERSGTPIGPLDTLIAAHALSLDAVLVTNNQREFQRVSGLRLDSWSPR